MKISYFNHNCRRPLRIWLHILSVVTGSLLAATVLTAQTEPPAAPNASAKKKIHITADKLISDGSGKSAEFIGNVHVSQENTLITADRMKFYYGGKAPAEEKQSADSMPAIEKIVATGNVKIRIDEKTASSSQAVYSVKSRLLVLTGPESTLSSGSNTIKGEKITLNRADESVVVEGSGEKRVEAVLHSTEGSLD